MKKAKKAAKTPAGKRKATTGKRAAAKARLTKKASKSTRKATAAPPHPSAQRKPARSAKGVSRQHARSAAKMAASVMSRRAAKAETQAQPLLSERPPLKLEPRIPSRSKGRHSKGAHARSGRAHAGGSLPGSRPVVRVARTAQFNYMRAPGAASGFDVGDSVEVFCDHELDGERVRGWVKGTVVQVDNKLVAVQFRSNVFLTDGWMVPDRILWYSLSSDQIRTTGIGKKAARVVIPEY